MINIQEAAAILAERRRTGEQGAQLPLSCRPQDFESALAIQQAVSDRWCELMDDSIGGWKCALPAQNWLIIAPIYTRTIDSVAPVSLWAQGDTARIEPELAFFLGKDLPARSKPYSNAEIDAAIARTHLALELIGCRYAEPAQCSFPEMLADGLLNQGLFIGPAIDVPAGAEPSELKVDVAYNGQHTNHPGKHPNGSPRAPIYWMVEYLRERGQGLVAGQAIITGSYAGVIPVPLDTDITITYEGLGTLSVNLKAKVAE